MIVLMLPRYWSKNVNAASAFKWAGTAARNLADAGHIVYAVVPKKEDGYTYDFDIFSHGHQNIKALPATLDSDTKMGAMTWAPDLLRTLTPRNAPFPYDIVMNMITPMSGGIHRCLMDVGYTRLPVPVLTMVGTAISYDEFHRHPVGIQEWYRPWEYLEMAGALFGRMFTGHPYDYQLLQRQAKKILSPSMAREAIKSIYHIWQPINMISEPKVHRAPKSSEPFRVLLLGGFGQGREEMGEQNELILRVTETLLRRKKKLKLVVCTQTAETDWHREVQQRLGDSLELTFSPSRPVLKQLFDSCHFAINLRSYDSINLSWLEQAAAGKPVIWWKTPYSEGWADDGGRTPFFIGSLSEDELLTQMLRMMKEYPTASRAAYDFAVKLCERHSPETWQDSVTGIMNEMVSTAQEGFQRASFKSMLSLFESLPMKQRLFSEVYDEVKKRTKAGTLGLYSRHWVLCMLRRQGWEEVLRDGELFVRPKARKRGATEIV